MTEVEGQSKDIWRQAIQKEIDEIKKDIDHLQKQSIVHDHDISEIKSTLAEIKDDTKWIRRTFTNAIVTATITAVIGGVIAIVFTVFKG
ncbi:MAG: hemolysin XhlA family protein [Bacillota bacterium]